ncbi:Beta-glucoside kinase [Alloiococcus otitis]|uniref:ROK family protein n=1 Tax=Alloiococcus otitis ATCC 51267 TaxID=883081 RepID=K9ECW9_9LACT|nr:ROK family protein [Alloiococcus otitis]EKU93701.1 hypothetical protein HMPREF9698_00818 [Alloiococcus otitis ATCC 51267]SUU80297.1 Beta-glucoside kinase [Alloiococcus otitis]
MKAICVDIGGTAIKYGILSQDRPEAQVEIQAKGSQNLDPKSLGGPNVPSFVFDLVQDYVDDSIDFIGISSAGVVDVQAGVIQSANENIPNYAGVKLKEELQGLTDKPVFVDNDVNCASLAEYKQGHAKSAEVALTLTLGTGVGGGLIYQGQVFRGAHSAAMEVGYLPLKDGSFEDLASVTGLIKRCEARLGQEGLEGKTIFDLALKEGNTVCLEEIDRLVDYLTDGLQVLCLSLDPDMVILGGGVMAQADYLIPRIQDSLDQKVNRPLTVKPAKYLNDAGILGAFFTGLAQLG